MDLESSDSESDDYRPSADDKKEVAFRESLAESAPVTLNLGPEADRSKFSAEYLNWYVWGASLAPT